MGEPLGNGPPPGLSPLEALGRIRAIVQDDALTPSEKLAVIAVVLHANSDTGLAWPGQRTIRREAGIGGKPIEGALACPKPGESRPRGKAVGRHVESAGRKDHGVQVWRVLPASPVGARCNESSVPRAGALNDGQRAPQDDQRASQEPQRASQEIQRPPEGRRTGIELKATGGEEKAPPPVEPRGDNGSVGARLKALAVRPATADEWEAMIGEDLRHGRYRREDLEAYLAGVGRIACWPRELVADVRAFMAARKAAAFRERLRTIKAEGLTSAEGPDGPGRVVYVEPDKPLMVIERRTPPPRGTSYGPQTKRWDVTTPEDLACWRFRAGAGGQSNVRACEKKLPAATASPALADLAEMSAELEAMACV